MKLITFIKGVCIGAGIMYLFDPNMGRRRRAAIRDKAAHAWNEAGDTVETTAKDLSNRVSGVIAETTNRIIPRPRSARKAMWNGSGAQWLPSNWSPNARLLLTAGAGLLAFYGKKRGGVLGAALGALSLSLITQSISKTDALSWMGQSSEPHRGSTTGTLQGEYDASYDPTAEHQPRTSRTH